MKHKQTYIICALLLGAHIGKAGEIPSEVKSLSERRDEKVKGIDRIYTKELEKLKLKYTKRGDLDGANTVVSIINKVENKSSKSHSANLNTSKFEGSWLLEEGSYTAKFHFKADGTVIKDSGKRANWLVSDSYFIIVYPDGGAKVFSMNTKGSPIKMNRIGKPGMIKKL